jgi:hypothetical protein
MGKNRSKQYNRMQERAHIAKKKRIVKNCFIGGPFEYDHQYSKNKIHCSCPLCRFSGPTYSDLKKTEKDKYSMETMDEELDYIEDYSIDNHYDLDAEAEFALHLMNTSEEPDNLDEDLTEDSDDTDEEESGESADAE